MILATTETPTPLALALHFSGERTLQPNSRLLICGTGFSTSKSITKPGMIGHHVLLWNVSLPEVPFLGFSALTGDVSDEHDIISVTTYSAILSNTNNPRGKIQLGESAYSGWFWTLTKIIFFLGAVAGVLYGYKTYALRSVQGFNSYPRSPGIGGGGYYEKRF